jgi:hypothetical protein
MAVSTYERDNRLNVLRGTAYAETANYYISLHSADPGLTGASELSGNGYARVAVSAATGSWSAPATNGSVREISNSSAITYPTATGAWTAATHFGIWSASTAGNFIRGSALTASKTVQSGDTASFAAGALVINEQ